MLESEVYGPLANWMKTRFSLEWSETTHENPCIVFNKEREVAEVDLILGNHKMNHLNLTDIVHVKTRDNLQQKKDRYELIGKGRFTSQRDYGWVTEKDLDNFFSELSYL